jgi:phage-related protein
MFYAKLSSLDDLRSFPEQARRAAGYQLSRVQQGLMPSDWKPTKAVGPSVYEIRIHTGVEHRVFYVAKYDDAIYVLHAFEKHARHTRQADIAVARQRLAELLESRRQKWEISWQSRFNSPPATYFETSVSRARTQRIFKVRAVLMIQISKLIQLQLCLG